MYVSPRISGQTANAASGLVRLHALVMRRNHLRQCEVAALMSNLFESIQQLPQVYRFATKSKSLRQGIVGTVNVVSVAFPVRFERIDS